jgi:hypothetical protein
VPDVDRERQAGILFPFSKNLALPATFEVIEIVSVTPFTVAAEKVGAPTVDVSLAFVIVTVRV